MVTTDPPERFLDFSIEVETNLVHKVVQSLVTEHSFHLRENCLDWVELGRVRNVENSGYLELGIVLWQLFLRVNRGIVHEQSKWSSIHLLRKNMDVVGEVKSNARVFLYLDMKYSFLCHRSYHVSMRRTGFCLTD